MKRIYFALIYLSHLYFYSVAPPVTQNNGRKKLIYDEKVTIKRKHSFLEQFTLAISMIVVFGVCSACTSIIHNHYGSQLVPESLWKTEVERYERSKGLFCEDIPELYDISNLRLGSMAKTNTTAIVVNRKGPNSPAYSTTKTISEIKTTGTGNVFAINMNYELPVEYFKEGLDLKPPSPLWMLTGPLVIAAYSISMSLELEKHYSSSYWEKETKTEIVDESSTKLCRIICFDKLKDFSEPKIINLQLISHEDLIISGSIIPCNVYQINKIFYYPNLLIRNDSSKIWISDKIPFGIVKEDTKSIFIKNLSSYIDMVETIYNIVVTEFKY